MEQQLTFFLALAAGLAFGALAVWLMLRADTSGAYGRAKSEAAAELRGLTERLNGKEARIADLTKDRDQLRAEFEKQRSETAALQTTKAELEARLAQDEKASQEKLAVINEARERLVEAFKALSAEALQNNNQAFLDLAKTSLEKFQADAHGDLDGRRKAIAELVTPLRESLGKVDSNLRELEKARAAHYAGLSEQVNTLRQTQDLLRAETSNLVHALRTPSVRGRWGEMQLRRVVEMAGMSPYCDFEEQVSVETEDGRLRPDMLIHLPNDRRVVVDAKVSLQAYLDAQGTADEAAKGAKLREHAAQIKTHLQRLSGKRYWDQFSPAPEFVVAFLPGEVFFSAALEQDPQLIEYGVERRVILATPTTLIALLKAVAYGWRQEKLTQSAEEIASLGKNLYSRLKTFSGYLEDIRKNLQRTVNGYNRAAGSFESRVLVSARRFRELGASAKGEIAAVQPIDTFPRSLQAIESATASAQTADPEWPGADEAEEPEAVPEPVQAEPEMPETADGVDESAIAESPASNSPELLWLPEVLDPVEEKPEAADTFPVEEIPEPVVAGTADWEPDTEGVENSQDWAEQPTGQGRVEEAGPVIDGEPQPEPEPDVAGDEEPEREDAAWTPDATPVDAVDADSLPDPANPAPLVQEPSVTYEDSGAATVDYLSFVKTK